MPKITKRATRLEIHVVKDAAITSAEVNAPSLVFALPIVKDLIKADREKFLCLHMNARNQVAGYEIVAIGTLNTMQVHPREVFKSAILSNAYGIIAVHNHPSGTIEPSGEDIGLTKRLKEAGTLLGIPLLDHIIVTEGEYLSFKDKNML